jgi:hypothetical protein
VGVIVLGTHRSGTSAVTRVIDLLGARVGAPQMTAKPDNPSGFWEVQSLVDLDDELLEHLGGSWDAPPLPEPGFEDAPDLAPLLARATEAFTAAHPFPRWVWKDPRACVALPFWRRVLGEGHPMVVVLRAPLAVTASLVRRNAIATELGLAIWERSTRGILRDAARAPAIVVDYDDVVDDPVGVVARLRSFLVGLGALDSSADVDDAVLREFVSADLRHTSSPPSLAEHPAASAEQIELDGLARSLLGEHDELPALPLPAETGWVADVVAARRAGNTGEAGTAGAGTSWRVALDRVLRRLGVVEAALMEGQRDQAELERELDAVEDALGYTSIGRLERVALGAAGRIRRVQQRVQRS